MGVNIKNQKHGSKAKRTELARATSQYDVGHEKAFASTISLTAVVTNILALSHFNGI